MYTLMTPGPVPLAPSVQAALQKPLLHHRTPEFESIFTRVLKLLPTIFQTQQHCCALTCTGTGVMEAALVNVFAPEQKVLVICAGKFGERWADMAEAYDLKTTRFTVEWGNDLNVKELESVLEKNKFSGLLLQACETSTGAQLPVQKISELANRIQPEMLVCVDAITALGAYELPMDKFKLDVVIGGAQKALMSPTGLGLIGLSERAWQICNTTRTLPRYYFDLCEERKSN